MTSSGSRNEPHSQRGRSLHDATDVLTAETGSALDHDWSDLTRRPGHLPIGAVTAPLVTLLHGRAELRSVLPAADLLDAFVRDGA